MNKKLVLLALGLLGLSGTAHAELQGRDLNGSADSFEAYYDTVLDITWLADANYAKSSGYAAANFAKGSAYSDDGKMTWYEANAWAANLSFIDGGNVYDEWRLPTVGPVNGTSFNYIIQSDGSTDVGWNITSPNSEMAYMFYVNLSNVGYIDSNTGLWTGRDWNAIENAGPFSNLEAYPYWSGSESDSIRAWHFFMGNGLQEAHGKDVGYYAWAVSPGDVGIAAIPEASTYAMMLAGLGLVGFVAHRRKQKQAVC